MVRFYAPSPEEWPPGTGGRVDARKALGENALSARAVHGFVGHSVLVVRVTIDSDSLLEAQIPFFEICYLLSYNEHAG